jgi:hypothetical protein
MGCSRQARNGPKWWMVRLDQVLAGEGVGLWRMRLGWDPMGAVGRWPLVEGRWQLGLEVGLLGLVGLVGWSRCPRVETWLLGLLGGGRRLLAHLCKAGSGWGVAPGDGFVRS